MTQMEYYKMYLPPKEKVSGGDNTEEKKKDMELKKEYLMGYQKAAWQLQRLEEELQEVRLNAICPSYRLDGMPKSHGKRDMSGYAARVDNLERKIMKARYRKIKMMKEIRDRIYRLDNEYEKDILIYRYIRGMKWEDITEKIHCSWTHTHRMHTSALKNFKME